MSRPEIDAIKRKAEIDLYYSSNAVERENVKQILSLCAYIREQDAELTSLRAAAEARTTQSEENYRAFAEVTEAYWKLEAAVKAHVAARASGRSVDIGETYRNLVAALRSEGASKPDVLDEAMAIEQHAREMRWVDDDARAPLPTEEEG